MSGKETNKELLEQLLLHIVPLQQSLESLRDMVLQTDRALRGNNGSIGIIARVSNLEEAVMALKKSIEEMVVKVDKLIDVKESAEGSKNSISFKWLVEKFALPIGTTLLTFFMIEVMPKLFQILGGK